MSSPSLDGPPDWSTCTSSAREATLRNADLASLVRRVQRHLNEAGDRRANDGATNGGANNKVTNRSRVKLASKGDADNEVVKGGALASPTVTAPSAIRAPAVGLALEPVVGSTLREEPPPLFQYNLDKARGGRAGNETADCATNGGVGDTEGANTDGHGAGGGG